MTIQDKEATTEDLKRKILDCKEKLRRAEGDIQRIKSGRMMWHKHYKFRN